MILNYQAREKLKQKPVVPFETANIVSIVGQRAVLRFPSGEVGQKKYRLSLGPAYSVGQTVKITKISGTYIVEGPLGV